MAIAMLTTEDNPFDPFDNFDEWYEFDERNGYHTTSYLGRIARTSPQLTPKEIEDEIERAMNEIIFYNVTGNYKKVIREV